MIPKFEIEIVSNSAVNELPNIWTDSDCKVFLDALEFGDASNVPGEHILWHIYTDKLPGDGERRQRYQLTLYCPVRWVGELRQNQVVECEPFVRDLEKYA